MNNSTLPISTARGPCKEEEKVIDTTKMKAPSLMMVLTAVGDYVYLRKDGMAVVPIGSLKD